MRPDHAFYLSIGWASALLLAVEAALLWRRWRRASHASVVIAAQADEDGHGHGHRHGQADADRDEGVAP